MRDNNAPAGADLAQSQATEGSPSRSLHTSIPESESSIRHGFARRDDKSPSDAPARKSGAKWFRPISHRSAERSENYRYSAEDAQSGSQKVACPAHHPMHSIALVEQQFGEIRAVLPGNPSDQRCFFRRLHSANILSEASKHFVHS